MIRGIRSRGLFLIWIVDVMFRQQCLKLIDDVGNHKY
jgi:hypothetical protein